MPSSPLVQVGAIPKCLARKQAFLYLDSVGLSKVLYLFGIFPPGEVEAKSERVGLGCD